MIQPQFEPWPKIPRLNKALFVVLTEKIDGTNAQIVIDDLGNLVGVGSRSRYITPESDNYGFARFVQENMHIVEWLGPGTHYGEWYGNGIQHGYGLKEKRFALFNTLRWDNVPNRPERIDVVPTLYKGEFYPEVIQDVTSELKKNGSTLVPGCMKPEGVVIYFPEFRRSAKWTYEAQEGKWKENE